MKKNSKVELQDVAIIDPAQIAALFPIKSGDLDKGKISTIPLFTNKKFVKTDEKDLRLDISGEVIITPRSRYSKRYVDNFINVIRSWLNNKKVDIESLDFYECDYNHPCVIHYFGIGMVLAPRVDQESMKDEPGRI